MLFRQITDVCSENQKIHKHIMREEHSYWLLKYVVKIITIVI